MSTPLSDTLFTLAGLAILIAQLMILRSTRRGMNRGMRLGMRGTASALEWSYAILPAVALVVVLAWTWRTMHAGTVVRFEPRPGASGPIS